MKRTAIMILLILCCLGLTVNVCATSTAESVKVEANVTSDSGCAVILTATVTYESDEASPVFPVPKNAENVTLNGNPATIYSAANSRMVSLKSITGGRAGTYSITIRYTQSAVVTATEEGGLLLELQLLSGFPFPIEDYIATISLPGEYSSEPELISGYYQQDVGDLLSIGTGGSQITVTGLQTLKDNETLSLRLPVDGTLFPQAERSARMLGLMDWLIIGSMLIGAIFYLFTMRPTLRRQMPRASAPDGVTAGETGLWYTGTGVDLTMLVVTWAQLGYIRIQVEKDGRVLLHRRMEMGNERSAYENKYFKELFGRRRIVDGTSYRYAELCRRLGKKSPRLKDIYLASSGNPYLYRGLCALGGVFSGVAIAGGFNPYSGVLSVLLGALAGVLALLIQNGGRYMPLRQQAPVKLALVGGALWLVLGIWSGQWLMALVQIVFQLLAGLALAYGGKRTDLGQQAQNQISGLRKHMRTVSKQELQRLLKSNPNYFYELAPYALALGLDKTFARRFARLRMPECTYLLQPGRGQLTATEWAALLRTTVNRLDARSKRLFWERLTGRR
ncbi:MAG: DUF2207 domain-containing protein [Ruminococcaceae bacterium]|nr:DUF2207 domain-containing protein [Oscillospiraceae bacterium]